MVVLLNVIIPLITFFLSYFAYKKRKAYPLVIAIFLVVIYVFVQPSYMPKGTVQKASTPEFEQVDKPIVDRVIKPRSQAERDERMVKEYADQKKRMDELMLELKNKN